MASTNFANSREVEAVVHTELSHVNEKRVQSSSMECVTLLWTADRALRVPTEANDLQMKGRLKVAPAKHVKLSSTSQLIYL